MDQNTNGKVFSKVLPFVHDGGPFGTVPELLFDKKHLISTLQQILSSTGKTDISLLWVDIESLFNLNLVAGLSLATWSLIIFQSNHTTTSPIETSSKLVTWGPYRFSRNPMYLSLTIIYLGEAGVLVQVWPLPLLLLTLIYVQLIVIPYEENQLQKQFGATYRQYCAKVLRWI